MAMGGHWTVLQSAAWASMLANNLRACSLPEAVKRTFDGHHPCKLCCQIAAGKKSEKQAELSLPAKKLEFTHFQTVFVFVAPAHFRLTGESASSVDSLTYAPPVPPPRPMVG